MKKKFKKLAMGAGIAAVAVGSLFSFNLLFSKTAYTVTQVIDGDTFETAEKQRIRIDGIQAPETGLCGADEATKELTKLILNKKVFIKVRYLDAYRRMISEVYDRDGKLVAEQLVNTGAVIVRQKGDTNDQLLVAGVRAREKGMGLYGKTCTQDVNLKNPSCSIKGNRRLGTNENLYHRTDCKNYKLTQVQLYLGDQWFCTEAEAQKAGFVKAGDCE